MKGNVKFFTSIFKIILISTLLMGFMSFKSYAIETMSFSDFDEIADDTSTGEGGSTTSETPKGQATSSSSDKKSSDEKTPVTKENIQTSSKDKATGEMPKTGSNSEIIFAVGVVALVSAGAVVLKKQSIKLK